MDLDLQKQARERRALARRTRQMGERLSGAAARARVTDTPMCWRNGRQSGRREPSKAGLGPLVTHQPDSISRAEKPMQLLFGAGLMLRRLLGR